MRHEYAGNSTIKDFDLNEDKLYLEGWPAGNRAISAAGGKITVGSKSDAVWIHVNNQLDQAHAAKIISTSDPKYKFVTATWDVKKRTFAFTEQ